MFCEIRKKIPYYFTKVKIQSGQHVYKQGDLDRSLYIVKKGEFTIYKCMKKPKNAMGDAKKIAPKMDESLRKDFDIRERINISRIGEKEYFGEVEFACD